VSLALVACFGGDAGLDAPCSSSDDCSTGLACLGLNQDTRCRKLGSAGDPCWSTDSTGCAQGFVCSQGLCISPGTKPPGDPCSYNVDCVSGLVCNWGKNPHICQPPALVGEPCGHPNDCTEGLSCTKDLLFSGVCDCSGCPASQVCGSRGCINPHTIQQGERCEHNADCQGDLVCVWATKPYLCAPARQLDEACGHPTDCAQGLVCDKGQTCRQGCKTSAECPAGETCFSGGVCKVPEDAGGSCLADTECKAGLWCGDGLRCTPRLSAGGICPVFRLDGAFNLVESSACQDGLSCVMSCEGDGTKGSCRVLSPAGESCSTCGKLCTDLFGDNCNGGCEAGLKCLDSICKAP